MSKIKSLVGGILRRAGREVISVEAYQKLLSRLEDLSGKMSELREYHFIKLLPRQHVAQVLDLLILSKAQFRQDIFVISELDFKRSGYFVEFGATNGVDLSNTWMLEREFGWTGILAEPARVWREALAKNRSCIIDHRCVWTESGKTLNFTEVDNPELSTIDSFKDGDMHGGLRKDSRHYEVPTISLTDLLAAHGAPREIDYLSIDTEGSEYDILSSFDFNSYHIRVITVEHNFTPARDKIRRLLEAHGFVRKLDAVSHVDDWYVNTRH